MVPYSITDKSKELHVELQITVSSSQNQRLHTSSNYSAIYHSLVADAELFVVWWKVAKKPWGLPFCLCVLIHLY